ncbi:MAG: aminotransferase class IV family protein [Sedimentisphaerales bacterium]|nr:aminotransferase class IV family protein [Sedimentisphaerales bacterium]
MVEKIFLNDKLVNIEDAWIPANDSGFLYGAGLFETMRACNGVVFRLEDHLDRLLTSAKALSIEHSYSKEYLADAVRKTLAANDLADARIRLTLSAGLMSQSQNKPAATLLITAVKMQPYPGQFYKNGVLVVLCPFRQNPADPTCGHKTTSYMSRMLALKQAHEKKAAEALWFTIDGRLAEGCVSNVFLVKDSHLYTPTTNTPVLPGIARKTVCELLIANPSTSLRTSKIELVEKDLTIDDLLGADEVFITNVIMLVLPVVGIEKHTVGNGKPGPQTKKIAELYEQFLKQSCKK